MNGILQFALGVALGVVTTVGGTAAVRRLRELPEPAEDHPANGATAPAQPVEVSP